MESNAADGVDEEGERERKDARLNEKRKSEIRDDASGPAIRDTRR